jgi:hypothetical protein
MFLAGIKLNVPGALYHTCVYKQQRVASRTQHPASLLHHVQFYISTYQCYSWSFISFYLIKNLMWADIATRYGLDGQGIESRWRRDFPNPSRPALGATHSRVKCVKQQGVALTTHPI